MNNKTFENLVLSLKELPGISKKQAEKISFYIIQSKKDVLNNLIDAFQKAKSNLVKCNNCNLISEHQLCSICIDKSRDNKLMVVESSLEVNKFEDLQIYSGKYFVVDSLIKNFDDKSTYFETYNKIFKILPNADEVILALSPTLEGEVSAIYIKNLINEKFPNLKISQLANGLPVGSQVEYIDSLTLNFAFKNRKDK
ncbi:recombination mediator RecR [[Mycoplasma] mobile]|uniref:Recombination protein RecR n=1 Tax=Mycoplasma mobile (strain ATCC 43663 / 163K / NCTC 11711) TaxID=267748 RepID=Q6KIL5_MYCM1|nr:recombination mediator RecR [[Mycoplasma] mobile]AAT27561.1 recombination protein [Mycoplasma mobile 163K]